MEEKQENSGVRDDDGPITFEDLGIKKAPQLTDSALGRRRELSDLTIKEKVFIVTTVISLLGVFVLAIIKIVQLGEGNDIKNPDFTFALIILANTVFCSYYLIHGVLTERPYEIGVLVIATLIVLVYIILNFSLAQTKGVVKSVRLGFACALSPVIIVLGSLIAKLYRDSGRLIFRTVGANSTLQEMCKTLFFFLGLLKFDLQLGVSMVLLILTNGMTIKVNDIVILAVGIPFSIVCFVLGYLCVRRENKILAYVYIPSLLLAPAYFIYKVVVSAEKITTVNLGIVVTTFACAFLAMIVRVLLAYFFVKTFLNFGNGLKQKVYAVDSTHEDKKAVPDVSAAAQA